MSATRKSLPFKYFYDERGSKLFDKICELDEYYLTRCELDIMRRHAVEMAEHIGEGVVLIEYGSGSSVKTRLLLDALKQPIAYVPVDISGEHLQATSQALRRRHSGIEVLPVCADFTKEFLLPKCTRQATHNAVYFPGSTIGNFEPREAEEMLRQIVALCGCGGGLLVGIDLQKEPRVIERAYNDASGVTAAFNLNLLSRINRELGADFLIEAFKHDARYDSIEHRVDIGLISQKNQTVAVGESRFVFAEGEKIHTEYSSKYTVQGFADLASQAGLTLRRVWKDSQERVAVLHLAILA